ncbi:uncharacterized protein MELLADRAFT_123218 [Melampsora larici-populina 98AG31]|uniref:Secreted protein n=1 Tax=Melampsora larici-populina (strain 98AG31 / pathotype 3-4-7) TaxID=747676 RepID=F4RAD3_MELLP|nr:uncharacterized protein MELLADRAFT_123218 [Melampsora larici-populina 98AG31]EGG10804.1 secreted protein [Melampsora larici-populina 98AG31]
MPLNVATVYFMFLLHNVLGEKPTTFPAPKDNTANPHSTCYKWLTNSNKVQDVSAYRLTSLQTSALTMATAEVNSDIKPTKPSKRISGSSGGQGACGVAYSGSDLVVCPWNGSGGQDDSNSVPGWLTGLNNGKNNCFKTVSVIANNRTVDGIIADGCAFTTGKPVDIDDGCSGIYLSDQMMSRLGFQDDETNVKITSWSFKISNGANKPW